MCRTCTGDLFGITSGIAQGQLAPKGRTAPDALPMTIFHGGKVITMDDRNPHAEAVAIAGGKIVAAGKHDDVLALGGSDARRIDLDGRTLMPGLIDPHQHPFPGGLMLLLMINVGPDNCKTKADALAAIKAKAASTPAGEWIYAGYYDDVLQGGFISMAELDAISTAHPIFVYYVSMHTATGNALAFQASGMTASTVIEGASLGKDAGGNLDGMIYEMNALMKFLGGLPKLTIDVVAAGLSKFMHQAASLGCTMIHEAGAFAVQPHIFDAYTNIMSHSPVRYNVSPMIEFLDQATEFVSAHGKPGARAVEIPGSLLSFYAVKFLLDGSLQQRTANVTEPYMGTDSKGHGVNYTPAQLLDLMSKTKAAGWPISIHCNGDGAIDVALDAMEAAYGPGPHPTGINRVEHYANSRPDQTERMKKLGAEPSFMMGNIYYYGSAYRDWIFGPARAERMYPAREFMQAGIPFSIHSDCPCSPVAPLRQIGTAVARRCAIDDSIVGHGQSVPIETALKGMTVVAARHCGLGEKLGSLEAGKYADLVILEDDPRTYDPAKLGDIKIAQTWVNGEPVSEPVAVG